MVLILGINGKKRLIAIHLAKDVYFIENPKGCCNNPPSEDVFQKMGQEDKGYFSQKHQSRRPCIVSTPMSDLSMLSTPMTV